MSGEVATTQARVLVELVENASPAPLGFTGINASGKRWRLAAGMGGDVIALSDRGIVDGAGQRVGLYT